MATRAEELQNLKTMQMSLDNIILLEAQEKKAKIELDYHKKRKIDSYFDYPEFTPTNYREQAQASIDSKNRKFSVLIYLIVTIPSIIALIVNFIIWCNNGRIENLVNIIEFIILFVPPLAIAFIPYAGIPIAIAIQTLLGCFWWFGINVINFSETVVDGDVLIESALIRNTFATGAIVLLISYSIGLIIYLIHKHANKDKNATIISQTIKKDEEELKIYQSKKAQAQIEFENRISIQESLLSEQVKKDISEVNIRINEIISKREHFETILRETPGLAPQDKNKHTVDTLISYFERGKADSIKEALNIFDTERTLLGHLESERINRMREAEDRRAILKRMADEQEEHNEKMRKKANEYSEKIDKAIDEIKYGK